MPDDNKDEEEQPDEMRTAADVARRCIVLYALIAAGHGESREELVAWLRREGVWEAVSPEESAFLLPDSPTEQQRINATWRCEALFPLLWALGSIADLPPPMELCDLQLIRSVLPPLLDSVGEFISSSSLRADTEIHAANEEIYQIHWRVRDFELRNEPTPPGKLSRMPAPDREPPVESYDPGVVYERHYALNWLIGYWGQDWDDITTDT